MIELTKIERQDGKEEGKILLPTNFFSLEECTYTNRYMRYEPVIIKYSKLVYMEIGGSYSYTVKESFDEIKELLQSK